MVLIYIKKTSPRLQYIAAFIFNELIKTPYAITSHADSFNKFDGIKLNYTDEKISDEELIIHPHGLLNETGITEQNIELFELAGFKAFFRCASEKETTFPFDIFAASFYLLSRYEEYLPHEKDKLGRYAHVNSLAYKNNFLNLPLVNIWINYFAEWLQNKRTEGKAELKFYSPGFKFIPTYDIDIAYSYLQKGFLRNAGGALRSALKFNINSIAERIKVLRGTQKDPFDNYDWLDELHRQYGLKPIYFFLVAEKNGKYDKNILPQTKVMQQLIKDHAKKYEIGLHPSWQSGDSESILKREKDSLENICAKEIKNSRQHYLRLTLPNTYRRLIDAGITDDHSMGYGSSNGFRASVASSFFWYDIEKEEQTKLRIHPFCYMDSNAIFQQKLLPQDAFKEMMFYYDQCKMAGGTFITIAHNNNLGSDKKDWRMVYEKFLKEIMPAE